MKILICGLGSIGSRHLNNLVTLGLKPEDIAVFRTKKGTPSFGDQTLAKHGNKNPVYYDLDEALEQHQPKAAFITNPTALHIPVALKCAKAGCDLFIEKPLSHTMDGVNELTEITQEKKLVVQIGYQMRFHPLIIQLKDWLQGKKLGRIIAARIKLGDNIVNYHTWEDYSLSYIVRKDLGGGAILSFSHEIDLIYHLFNMPEWVFCAGGHLSNLSGDTDDTVECIMKYPEQIISLHFNFLQIPPERSLEIVGSTGMTKLNLISNYLQICPYPSVKRTTDGTSYSDFDKNKLFTDELSNFLDCVKYKKTPVNSLESGKKVLEICLAMKQSLAQAEKVLL